MGTESTSSSQRSIQRSSSFAAGGADSASGNDANNSVLGGVKRNSESNVAVRTPDTVPTSIGTLSRSSSIGSLSVGSGLDTSEESFPPRLNNEESNSSDGSLPDLEIVPSSLSAEEVLGLTGDSSRSLNDEASTSSQATQNNDTKSLLEEDSVSLREAIVSNAQSENKSNVQSENSKHRLELAPAVHTETEEVLTQNPAPSSTEPASRPGAFAEGGRSDQRVESDSDSSDDSSTSVPAAPFDSLERRGNYRPVGANHFVPIGAPPGDTANGGNDADTTNPSGDADTEAASASGGGVISAVLVDESEKDALIAAQAARIQQLEQRNQELEQQQRNNLPTVTAEVVDAGCNPNGLPCTII